jgi:hypothetical protein
MLSALGSELCDDAYGLRSVLAFDPEILDRSPVTPVADGNLICPAGFEDPFAPRQIELPREQN